MQHGRSQDSLSQKIVSGESTRKKELKKKKKKKKFQGWRELAQQLRTVVTLPENSGFHSQHLHSGQQSFLTPAPRRSDTFLWPARAHCMHMAHRHTSRQNNHTCKIKINLKICFDKNFEVFYALRKKKTEQKKTPKQGTVANVLILALRRKRKVGL